MPDRSWIVVVDSPFLPARGGGEQEHLGIVKAAARAGVLALVVMPSHTAVDLAPYRDALGEVPFILTPRRSSPLWLLHPRVPFVVASRPAPSWLPGRARALAPAATGVLTTSYKSWRVGERVARELDLPMVLRHHNREGDYHRSLAAGSHGARRVVLRWEARRITGDERRLARAEWLNGTADISADDARARRAEGGRNVEHVPPFALALDGTSSPVRRVDTAPRVLFLGALDVPTNTTALEWLLDRVWPLVRTGAPDAVLDVVGRRPSSALRHRLEQQDGVELHADVPDLAPYLHGAAVAVNPAVSGSGVNIKVLDYMRARVPLVSTSLATRGLPLREGVDLAVSDDPQSFAHAVLGLLADREGAERMAATGWEHLREALDPVRNLERIAQMLEAPR